HLRPPIGGPRRRTTRGRLAGPPPANLRTLVAERGVGERLQRFVQVTELVRDHGQLLARLLAAVEARELGDEPVEPFEQRFELAVGEVALLHAASVASPRAWPRRAAGPRHITPAVQAGQHVIA